MMEEDIVVPEKKKRSPFGRILLVLFLFLILVIGGGVYLIYKNTTAENILKNNLTITNIATKAFLNGKQNFAFDTEKDHMINKMVINIKGEGDSFKALDGLGLDIRNSFSIKEEYFDVNAYVKQNDASLGVNAYVTGDKVYFESKDINLPLTFTKLDENIFTTLKEELNGETKLQATDISYAVEKITQYINEGLTSSNTSTSNKGVVYTFKYMINNKNNDDPFIKNLIESITADKDLMKILETDEETLKNIFSNLVSLDVTVTYNVLKREYSAVDGVIVTRDGDSTKETKFTFEQLSNGDYKFTSGDLVIDFKSVSEGTSIEVSLKGDKKVTMRIFETSDNVFKIDGTILMEYDVNGKKDKTPINYNLIINFNENKVEYEGEVSVKIDKDSLSIKFESSVEVRNDSIIKGDFKDARDMEKMSQDELAKVYSAAMDKIGKFELYKMFQAYANQLATNMNGQSTTM